MALWALWALQMGSSEPIEPDLEFADAVGPTLCEQLRQRRVFGRWRLGTHMPSGVVDMADWEARGVGAAP
ncbi:hypothetical protein FRC09_016793, partial [Ceratobasidium sp. 395]